MSKKGGEETQAERPPVMTECAFPEAHRLLRGLARRPAEEQDRLANSCAVRADETPSSHRCLRTEKHPLCSQRNTGAQNVT